MNFGVLNRIAEFYVVLLGLENLGELLAEVDFFRRGGIIFGDDVWVARDSVDDD